MTVADLSANGRRPLSDLSDDEARERAEEMARADSSLSGRELGGLFGRGERWGRRRLAAVRPATGGARPGRAAVTGAATPPPVATRASVRTDTVRAPARRAARPRKAGQRTWSDQALTVIGTAGAILVAVVTARVSYTHVRDLAAAHGMGELAGWLPLGVDGLVITCSCSLIVDRRSATAWAGVVIGLIGSVAANVLAAPAHDLTAQLLAAYSPVALAVAVHEVFRLTAKLARP